MQRRGDQPLVVLLGKHRADEANHGAAIGKDADDIGASSDLFVEPLH
jgi:hypothetical protein